MSFAMQWVGGLLALSGVRALSAQDKADLHYIFWGVIFLAGLQLFVFGAIRHKKAGKP